MYGGIEHEIGCDEFQAMLADALDGVLSGPRQAAFEAHRRTCALCAPLHAEAETGLRWLQLLKAEELATPPLLLDSILQATSRPALPSEASQSWWRQARDFLRLPPFWRTVSQPRFAMSFAMTFVALSAILSFTGVRLGELRTADFQPVALENDWYQACGKVQRYYENIRFVYEFESRLRELRQIAMPPEGSSPEPSREPRPKSERPETPNPSHSEHDELRPILASASQNPGYGGIAVSGTEISGWPPPEQAQNRRVLGTPFEDRRCL
jgi:hypothetical protein